jgi:hypothetical protein
MLNFEKTSYPFAILGIQRTGVAGLNCMVSKLLTRYNSWDRSQ